MTGESAGLSFRHLESDGRTMGEFSLRLSMLAVGIVVGFILGRLSRRRRRRGSRNSLMIGAIVITILLLIGQFAIFEYLETARPHGPLPTQTTP
jgi:uncharacterized BrkB/YihY/UPF0761 family membrane protein